MTDRERDLAKDIMNQLSVLESERSPWETIWQDVADLIHPIRSDIKQTRESGLDQTTQIFDDTARIALDTFANGLYGHMVSPSIDWFKFNYPDEKKNNEWELVDWFQSAVIGVYSALSRSNFYLEMLPLIKDTVSLGTGIMYYGDKDGKDVMFSTIHLGQVYIAEDQLGRVDTLFRKFRAPVRNIIQRFGYDKCPESIRRAYDANRHDLVEVIHAVVPREDYEEDALDNNRKKYASIWLSGNGDFIKESGYSTFPYVVWRYDKTSPETYGRGPAINGLPSIKSMNVIRKTMLQSAELSVNPPMNVPAEMRGRVNIKARGLNFYDAPDRRIYPLELGDKYPVGVDMMDRVRNDIRDMFNVPFFLMLSAAERNLTATEVIERQGEKASVLGPIIVRFTTEVLMPVLDFVLKNEIANKRIPPPPKSLQDKPYDIEFLGPLAQAQRKFFKSSGITRSLELILPVTQMAPQALDNIDVDGLVREVFQTNGMPASVIRPEKDMAKIRKERMDQQKEQQMLANSNMAADAMKKLGDAGGEDAQSQMAAAMKGIMPGG